MLVCDKHDRAVTYVLCRGPRLTLMLSGLCKKNPLKESEVWRKVISNKIIVTLVTQGCRLLSSSVLLRKFTTVGRYMLCPFADPVACCYVLLGRWLRKV